MEFIAKRLLMILLVLSLAFWISTVAESPVPDILPDDLGGKTLYGYLMDLKTTYAPSKVFSDAAKYSDADRENARRALHLIDDVATKKMEETGTPDQYNLYLRAYANDLLFQDSKDPVLKVQALEDYLKTVELGGAYAQADHDRLAAMEIQAAPLDWQVAQLLTPKEVGEILKIDGDDLFLVSSAYQIPDGSRLGVGYANRAISGPADSAIFVLADPQGGKGRYEVLKRLAFLNQIMDIPDLGNESVSMGLRNMYNDPSLYTTVLVLKDPLVLQVRVPDRIRRNADLDVDPVEIATRLAHRFLSNLVDPSRKVQAMDAFAPVDIMPRREFDPGLPDSPVPLQLPEDLEGKTVYGYLVGLRNAYLPGDIFSDAKYSEANRNNARRALRLIADTISRGFDMNGPNPYELEIRGACYAAAFQDTGDPSWRALAINDYKQALNSGFVLAKADYDRLASPLMDDMADLSEGDSGEKVLRLQNWLKKAGYLEGQPSGEFDGATRATVELFEKETGLSPDGIADMACILALYARIDDGDELYFSR